MKQDFTSDWHTLTDEVMSGMKEWRQAHPKATLKEIEQEIDVKPAGMRARMIANAAMASAAEEQPPKCQQCGGTMEWRGEHVRMLVTQHDREVELKRHYAVCPTCNVGRFPPG